MTSSSSFVAHFANNASVGLFALNAFVKDISCGVIAISADNAVVWQASGITIGDGDTTYGEDTISTVLHVKLPFKRISKVSTC